MLKDRRDLCILVLFNKTFVSISSIKYVLVFVTENGEYISLSAADEVFSVFTTRFSLLVVFLMMHWKYLLGTDTSASVQHCPKI